MHALQGLGPSMIPSALGMLLLLVAACCEARHPELLLPSYSKPPCQGRNLKLSNFIRARSEESGQTLLPHRAQDLDEFVTEVKAALDSHMLGERALQHLFSDAAEFNPTCAGIWAEFGVASGESVNFAAKFRRDHCSASCPPVYGFDTFTGLPERWERDSRNTWEQQAFDQGGAEGKLPAVEVNVHLVKGLFNESLPNFLKEQAIYASSDEVVSYLHIDCDLYGGARDALNLLASQLRVGTVVLFDDLLNYEHFRQHEIKAMWEWLSSTGTRLLPIGMLGPLPGKSTAVELDWSAQAEGAAEWHHQSAAFVIAHQSPVEPRT